MIGVILAAGRSSRFKHVKSKLEYEFKGKPIVKHVFDSLNKSVEEIIVVVGENENNIKKILGDNIKYIKQEQALGTGNAVLCCESYVKGKFIVCNGDKPLVTKESFDKLKELKENIGVSTIISDNPLRRGRIIRENNIFKEIKEFKDASDSEKEIKEVNAGIYLFDDKVFEYLKKVKNNNASKEYYLTDVFSMYVKDKIKIGIVNVSEKEGFDVNTLEEVNMIR